MKSPIDDHHFASLSQTRSEVITSMNGKKNMGDIGLVDTLWCSRTGLPFGLSINTGEGKVAMLMPSVGREGYSRLTLDRGYVSVEAMQKLQVEFPRMVVLGTVARNRGFPFTFGKAAEFLRVLSNIRQAHSANPSTPVLDHHLRLLRGSLQGEPKFHSFHPMDMKVLESID